MLEREVKVSSGMMSLVIVKMTVFIVIKKNKMHLSNQSTSDGSHIYWYAVESKNSPVRGTSIGEGAFSPKTFQNVIFQNVISVTHLINPTMHHDGIYLTM